MELDFMEQDVNTGISIKVFGVGGGGNNAVNRMISTNIRGVEFIAVNTDCQALRASNASTLLEIGKNITGGRGAGSNPEVGRRAAEESIEEIKAHLAGADMVFITAGMGGGTGTGAAPVIAAAAKEMGILTVGIVTTPFSFEGKKRIAQAAVGIETLLGVVDSLIVVPNEGLRRVSEERLTLANAFEMADDVLLQGVKGVSNLINVPGFVNLDFADVSAVMENAGFAHMAVGIGRGPDKAELAAKQVISSPLLETSITGASGILVSITGGPDVPLDDVYQASNYITEQSHPDANIIWGATFDPELTDELQITIIATGFERAAAPGAAVPKRAGSFASFEPAGVAMAAPAAPVASEVPSSAAATETPKAVAAATLSDQDFNDALEAMNERSFRGPKRTL